MLSISRAQLDRAYQDAHAALLQAYGQHHETPDGKFCWMGRIDRAFALLAKTPGDKVRASVEKLCKLGQNDLSWADKKIFAYHELCQVAGVKPRELEVSCTCPYCQRFPMIHEANQ